MNQALKSVLLAAVSWALVLGIALLCGLDEFYFFSTIAGLSVGGISFACYRTEKPFFELADEVILGFAAIAMIVAIVFWIVMGRPAAPGPIVVFAMFAYLLCGQIWAVILRDKVLLVLKKYFQALLAKFRGSPR